MDQLSDKITESALEFHHQLKSQKEKTIYNLYHTGWLFFYVFD